MPAHYGKSPSASSRWLQCTKSIELCKDAPNPDNEYTQEGTLAHEYAAAVLQEKVVSDPEWTEGGKEAVAAYLAFVKALRGHDVLSESVEVQLVSSTIDDFGGTIDYLSIYKDEEGRVWAHIVDYKHGKGVVVGAEGNSQLLCYLVLVHEHYPHIKNFRASICQPRTSGEAVETVEVELEEVEAFRKRIVEVDNSDPKVFVSGEHCGWCPALPTCPCVYEQAMEVFDVSDLKPEEEGKPSTEWIERWTKVMDAAPAIKKFIDSVPGWILGELKSGGSVPGYKAVRSYGNRAWVPDDEEVIKLLAKKRIGKKISTVAKLKSPTQMEKEGYGEVIESMVHRPERGLKVVPESDKRDAVTFESSDTVFNEVDLSFLEE